MYLITIGILEGLPSAISPEGIVVAIQTKISFKLLFNAQYVPVFFPQVL